MLSSKLVVPVATAAVCGYALFGDHQSSPVLPPSNRGSDIAQIESVIRANTVDVPIQQSISLENVFRFDVYPNWVKSNWPRVSTAPGENGLTGMRVSLVTGHQPHDLDGSLTYYFDDAHRVQRIQFVGYVDDARPLVAMMTRNFNFETQRSLDAGFYVSKTWRKTSGVMKLHHPSAIYTQRPRQMKVILELLAEDSRFELSPAAKQLLAAESRH